MLEELFLDIAAGESVSLIGESGCGKSTLLHMLAGLLTPTEGSIKIQGRQVIRPNPEWNMMFQRPGLYPWLNVEQNVALGLKFTGKTANINSRVREMLELVSLENRGKSIIQDLSGGQQQRVALARSLAVEPQVILLDEPFSALDAFTRRNLQREVTRISQDKGITLVLVTHDIDEAIAMGQKIVVMGRNPGTFRNTLEISQGFPRNLMSADLQERREELMRKFRESVGYEAEESESTPALASTPQPKEQINA